MNRDISKSTKMAWSPSLTNEDFPLLFDDWTVEDKVRLFEDQVLGWQLKIADDIINTHASDNPHAGFAVLSILLNYFEMIGKHIQGYVGNSQSKAHFRVGLVNVFPELRDKSRVISVLYEDARCGMYHEALIGKRIILTRNYDVPIHVIDENIPIIAIDPHSLTTNLIGHFTAYIGSLRSAEENDIVLRNFIKRFNFLKRGKADLQRSLIIDSAAPFS